jgi:2-polyprenyl-3-methyl-5-hydroxy-6-metoxy-1,4-benzoquinol methylase
MKLSNCRGCNSSNFESLIDLGNSPVSNDFLPLDYDVKSEPTFPLHAIVCMECSFVQLSEILTREDLFKPDYVYFSSFSKSWLAHCEDYTNMILNEIELDSSSLVIEIASNDGYLLQYFLKREIKVLGIEPTLEPAKKAREDFGIPTVVEFFGKKLAQELVDKKNLADLIIGNNVLAHVPDIHDFISGVALLLKMDGVATFEFPHLVSLLKQSQFDTIYHEHYSYLSLTALIPIFRKYGLEVSKVERLQTHGGSLRVYVKKATGGIETHTSVLECLADENVWDPRQQNVRENFQNAIAVIKSKLIEELRKLNTLGTVIAFGAAAKGNTLLNYCGVNKEEIICIVDSNTHKQNMLAPGSHIKVVSIDDVKFQPDYVLILPWNLKGEIISSLENTILGNAKMLIAIPEVKYVW